MTVADDDGPSRRADAAGASEPTTMRFTRLVLDAVSGVRSTTGVHHECRACGTTVAGTDDDCPYCGDSRIATFYL